VRFVPAGEPEVVERHVVDRADCDRRAVLRRHVAERGTVRDREELQTRSIELDEFSDDAELAEPFGDREHQIGGGRPLRQPVHQSEADDLRDEHRDGLSEHRGFGFDSAHPPADNPKPVHHRRVRVGADERVRIGENAVAGGLLEDDAGQVFEIDLMDDPGVRWHDAEVLKRFLPPAEEHVAFPVARELERCVEICGVQLRIMVYLNRMIDDKLDWLEGVDLSRIPAETNDAVAHRRKVDNRRNAREILEQHARRCERNLLVRMRRDVPLRERGHVLRVHETAILAPQQVFEKDFE
jgi:hypothetical protein